MYSAPLHRIPFQPDESGMLYREEREAYRRKLVGEETVVNPWDEERTPQSLQQLLEMVSPEDSALLALIVFLLCDNSNNDVVLIGILLYVLLSK
jgi:trehalose-6-phosphate synthase